jgi:tetratricopeptide (TPR) repeat protein
VFGIRRKALGAFLALALIVLPVRLPAASCTLGKYAELPVTMAGTMPLVTGSINGVETQFLADTGSFFSMLTREAAVQRQLKLRPLPQELDIRGIGGSESAYLTTAKEFLLTGYGKKPIKDVDFVVTGNKFAADSAGLLGQNVLGVNDMEFDLANGAIRLFVLKDCKGANLAYWSGADAVAEMKMEFTSDAAPQVVGKATLNGSQIRVMFDSGSSRSILTLRAAARAGVKPSDDKVIASGLSVGLGARGIETWTARFDSFDLGGELIKNGRLVIGDIELTDADMLLGADFFLSHRIIFAKSQREIFFTYNGGPVFNLNEPQRKKPAPAPPAVAPDSGTTTANAGAESAPPAPTDAAGYRRRGTAFAARKDFNSAIADFDQAITLDPADADSYFQRGMARWHERELVLAMADFDQALKIKPDDIPALFERGRLRLASDDEVGARVDFTAIAALAPTDASIGLRIADSYESAGDFAAAIDQLDQWIASHPKDDRVPDALHDRCWSRAMTGKDLELALADCDAALRRSARNSQLFNSRAFVRLQLGNYDKAISDYKASLDLQPKGATSLYGLGLAERKKGLQTAADKDIQAAIAIDPDAAVEFKHVGLVP